MDTDNEKKYTELSERSRELRKEIKTLEIELKETNKQLLEIDKAVGCRYNNLPYRNRS